MSAFVASTAIPFRTVFLRTVFLRISAAVLLVLTSLAPASRADDSGQAAAAKILKDAEKKLDECFDHALDELKGRLAEIKIQIIAGDLDVNQAFDALNKALSKFTVSLNQHQLYVTFEVQQKLSALAQQPNAPKDLLLVGAGGAFDQWLEIVKKKRESAYNKGVKRSAKLAKFLGEFDQGKLELKIQPIPSDAPAEAPGNPKPPTTPLSITGIGSAHAHAVKNDGKLFVSGIAPNPFAPVTVKIHGPNGETISKTVTSNGDGTFDASFPNAPGAGAGNLAEGNWRIEASSNGQCDEAVHGI